MVLQSRIVSEIFNVEKYRDRQIRVKGYSRSLKVVPFDRLVRFPISVLTLSLWRIVFEIFDFENAVTLKTGLWIRQGHWGWCHSIRHPWLPVNVP